MQQGSRTFAGCYRLYPRSQVISDLVTHSLELGVYCSDFHIKTQNRIAEDICDCSHICDSWLHLELSTAYFNETPRLLK